jgi:zinc transport system substrate-binding protein
MTTIFPLQEFAQAVVGNRGDAELLLPPGAEIHAWQPRPSDLMKLSSADVFIYIGAQLEPWADDILRSVQNPDLLVIEASEGMTLIGHEEEEGGEHDHEGADEHSHEAGDPHIWLDFAYDKKIIDRIAEVLSRIDPDGKATFEENAAIYKQKLDALDEMYQKNLDQCDQKTIVLGGHAAFGYLARRYDLSQISLYGLSPDSKPTPRQLIDVINIVKEKGIQAIFFEVNISSELARVIAEETGAKTLVLNPGASLPRGQNLPGITFLDIMEKNLESLKNGLRCR